MCSAKIVDLKNGLVYANKAKTRLRAYSQQQMHTMSEMKNSKVFMAYLTMQKKLLSYRNENLPNLRCK